MEENIKEALNKFDEFKKSTTNEIIELIYAVVMAIIVVMAIVTSIRLIKIIALLIFGIMLIYSSITIIKKIIAYFKAKKVLGAILYLSGLIDAFDNENKTME